MKINTLNVFTISFFIFDSALNAGAHSAVDCSVVALPYTVECPASQCICACPTQLLDPACH